MTKIIPIKLVTAPYVAFLFDKINKVYDAWDTGDTELALKRALRIVLFLPRSLKTQLEGDYKYIKKEMQTAYDHSQSNDFFDQQLRQGKAAREKARQLLEPFVDKLIDAIDEAGLIEHKARDIETNIPKEAFQMIEQPQENP
jgi:hypothetical protein